MKAFDGPTPEELIQKPSNDRGQHEEGSGISVKIS
jgi:hypothetical protein